MMKNINISKKFLIFFSLILSLLFINSNNVKAYYEETDTIYSNTLKFNADDYYQDNLFYFKDSNFNQTKFFHLNLNTNNNELKFTCTGTFCYGNVYITNKLEINKNYTFIFESYTTDTTKNNRIGLTNIPNNVDNIIYGQKYVSGNTKYSINFTAQNNNLYLVAYLTGNDFSNEFNTTLSNIMIVEGSNVPNTYSEPFRFGYMVSNTQSNAFTLQFIDNYNNNNTYTLTNNSSVYLPFQYLNKEVTFSYNVNQNVSSDINSNVNITFTPIFSGTLKSNNSNVLKSTFTYVYNYIYYKNFKLSSYQNIYLDDLLEINYPTTNRDGKALTLTSVISPNNVISNFTSDIKQTSIIDKDIYFNGNNSVYKFDLVTYMYTNNNGLLYSINFESINLGVVNSSVSNSFPTNTDNDLEIYNTCSGNIFQDFNCNVTNAVTWTIFNIPIIGPLIGFISNLIQLIGQLVSALEWYESLGILFSIFILIMFIKILGILWKGKDE